jgi:hypothetical protein
VRHGGCRQGGPQMLKNLYSSLRVSRETIILS